MAASRQHAALQAGTGERAVSLSPVSRALNALKRCKSPHWARFAEQFYWCLIGVDVEMPGWSRRMRRLGCALAGGASMSFERRGAHGFLFGNRRKSIDGFGPSMATTRVIQSITKLDSHGAAPSGYCATMMSGVL